MAERRKGPRQRRRLRVTLGAQPVYTADVTGDGFSAELMHVLEPGSVVTGDVSLGTEKFSFDGRVVWARAGDRRLGQRGRMGVRFARIDEGFAAAYQKAFPTR